MSDGRNFSYGCPLCGTANSGGNCKRCGMHEPAHINCRCVIIMNAIKDPKAEAADVISGFRKMLEDDDG